jgi:hypothetical protein
MIMDSPHPFRRVAALLAQPQRPHHSFSTELGQIRS